MNTTLAPTTSIVAGPIGPLPFDNVALNEAAVVEYGLRGHAPDAVDRRTGVVADRGYRLVAGTTVEQAVQLLHEDINATTGPVTGAVLQAADGTLYVTRAYTQGGLTNNVPMPLDATGFERYPMGVGGRFDPDNVRVTASMPELKALVGYETWVDTSRTGETTRPQPWPAA